MSVTIYIASLWRTRGVIAVELPELAPRPTGMITYTFEGKMRFVHVKHAHLNIDDAFAEARQRRDYIVKRMQRAIKNLQALPLRGEPTKVEEKAKFEVVDVPCKKPHPTILAYMRIVRDLQAHGAKATATSVTYNVKMLRGRDVYLCNVTTALKRIVQRGWMTKTTLKNYLLTEEGAKILEMWPE